MIGTCKADPRDSLAGQLRFRFPFEGRDWLEGSLRWLYMQVRLKGFGEFGLKSINSAQQGYDRDHEARSQTQPQVEHTGYLFEGQFLNGHRRQFEWGKTCVRKIAFPGPTWATQSGKSFTKCGYFVGS